MKRVLNFMRNPKLAHILVNVFGVRSFYLQFSKTIKLQQKKKSKNRWSKKKVENTTENSEPYPALLGLLPAVPCPILIFRSCHYSKTLMNRGDRST